jgi:hypothetical protein
VSEILSVFHGPFSKFLWLEPAFACHCHPTSVQPVRLSGGLREWMSVWLAHGRANRMNPLLELDLAEVDKIS